MRAAISYHYAQEDGRGSEKWHQDHQGMWLGNPALSHIVSRYMISLQRRKVLSYDQFNQRKHMKFIFRYFRTKILHQIS